MSARTIGLQIALAVGLLLADGAAGYLALSLPAPMNQNLDETKVAPR